MAFRHGRRVVKAGEDSAAIIAAVLRCAWSLECVTRSLSRCTGAVVNIGTSRTGEARRLVHGQCMGVVIRHEECLLEKPKQQVVMISCNRHRYFVIEGQVTRIWKDSCAWSMTKAMACSAQQLSPCLDTPCDIPTASSCCRRCVGKRHSTTSWHSKMFSARGEGQAHKASNCLRCTASNATSCITNRDYSQMQLSEIYS